VQDFLQTLEPTFLVRRWTGHLLMALQIEAVSFSSDLRYSAPKLCGALFDGLVHGDSLAEQANADNRRNIAISLRTPCRAGSISVIA
jgi:hypothetical protein